MKRVGLIAILALAVTPGVAHADFKTGKYKYSSGATSRCDVCSISFKASSTKVSKLAFKVSTKKPACDSGQRMGDNSADYKAVSGAIEDDKFAITLSLQNSNGVFTAKVKGRLSGSTASGTLRSVYKFPSGNECDSGKLKWTAKRS